MNTKPAEFVAEAKKFENLNATVPDGQEISFLAFLKYLANGRETRKNQAYNSIEKLTSTEFSEFIRFFK